MENFENERKYVKCKEGCLKYFVIFIATIIGAFLAFYVVTDYTIKTMLSPEYQMRKAEKLMKDETGKDFIMVAWERNK